MKVEARVLEVDSTIEGESIVMSINPEDMPFIQDILIDLYEDPEMAVVREYSTNAYDAHVEAGVTRPIEVSLPTDLSPAISIRDYGEGLDADDIREVYSRYGASLKRHSNDFNGMLGLGCKSALTYTDQFTLVGIKNGVATSVLISRDENGGGRMRPIDTYETDEPSGVEVIIPAKKYNTLARKAAELFKYWKKGTVLVDGAEPEMIDGFWIADDLLLLPDDRYTSDVVVMGNVAYPFPEDDERFRYRSGPSYKIVAFAPIGSVEFVPNREGLRNNAKTKAAIEAIKERVKEEAGAALTRKVAEAKTMSEALHLFHQGRDLLGEVDALYKNKEIPTGLDAPKSGRFIVVTATKDKRHRSKGWSYDRAHGSQLWDKTMFLTGYDGGDFSPTKRKKIDQWREENDIPEPDYYVLWPNKTLPNRSWLSSKMVHSWEGAKDQKIKRDTVTTNSGRISGSYRGKVDGTHQYEILATEIDTNHPVLWTELSGWVSGSESALIEKHHPNYTLVYLGANRIAKFQRDFPMAKKVGEFARELAQSWEQKLTDKQKKMIHLSHSDSALIRELKGVDFDDPELTENLDVIHNRDQKLINEYVKYYDHMITIEYGVELFENYPLLDGWSFYGTMEETVKEHIKLYVNAAYAAKEDQ